jgi:hypothetical protein
MNTCQNQAWHKVGAQRAVAGSGPHSLLQLGAAGHVLLGGLAHEAEDLLQRAWLVLACTGGELTICHSADQLKCNTTGVAGTSLCCAPMTAYSGDSSVMLQISEDTLCCNSTLVKESNPCITHYILLNISKRTWKQWLPSQQLKHDAAGAPHVNLRPVVLRPQEQLRRPVP